MALRQSAFAPLRQVTPSEIQDNAPTAVLEQQQRAFEESQEWVLFSPHPAHKSSQVGTNYSPWPSRTDELSRNSDFGSLDTAARAGQYEEDISDTIDDAAREDEDLDSLDEGLHAFQEPLMYQSFRDLDQNKSVLPAHDGLGTFSASSVPVQELLWRFEEHNPRKRPIEQPGWSNVQRYADTVGNDGSGIEVDRIERIEQWRLEQFKILLDEIERETRKRRSTQSDYSKLNVSPLEKEQTINKTGHVFNNPGSELTGAALGTECGQAAHDESLWERITQLIIRDFLGIDEALLSVIFGESLHPDENLSRARPSSISSSRFSSESIFSLYDADRDARFLDRIGRELGVLVQHLSKHPGAFTTPLDPVGLDYAGIPISNINPPTVQPETPDESSTTPSASHYFKPTLQDHSLRRTTTSSDTTHAALWGIEEEDPIAVQDREYWEGAPDVRTIFRLLQHRFTAPHQPPRSPPTDIATTTTPASLRRAALIRQHHPLVSRPPAAAAAAAARRNRSSPLHHHLPPPPHRPNSSPLHSLFKRPPESSCASVGVRRAKRRSGSSRNYWDVGGSGAESGSLRAGPGGLGAWGEV